MKSPTKTKSPYEKLVPAVKKKAPNIGGIIKIFDDPRFLWEHDIAGEGLYRNQIRAQFVHESKSVTVKVWYVAVSSPKKRREPILFNTHLLIIIRVGRKVSWKRRVVTGSLLAAKFVDRVISEIDRAEKREELDRQNRYLIQHPEAPEDTFEE
ncbi:MAG: hypothetical protein ABSF47_03000 [Minisyncoccia bacterium]